MKNLKHPSTGGEIVDDLLGAFEITMNYFVGVKIVHALGYLLGPIEHSVGRNSLLLFENIIKRTVRAIFHDDAETWRLRTNSPVDREHQCNAELQYSRKHDAWGNYYIVHHWKAVSQNNLIS